MEMRTQVIVVRIFIGEGGVDGNGDANNITVIGGQYFTDMLDHVAGTLTGSSALIRFKLIN